MPLRWPLCRSESDSLRSFPLMRARFSWHVARFSLIFSLIFARFSWPFAKSGRSVALYSSSATAAGQSLALLASAADRQQPNHSCILLTVYCEAPGP